MYLRMPIFRVWSADRTIKKTVVSSADTEALKTKGKENNANNFCTVLELRPANFPFSC